MRSEAAVTLVFFPPTAFAVCTTGNPNFSGCASHTTKVGCLYQRHKQTIRPVSTWRQCLGYNSKGCCGLWCCFSNYGLLCSVKYKVKAIVSMIMASKKVRQECLPKPTTLSWLGIQETAVGPSSNGWREMSSVTVFRNLFWFTSVGWWAKFRNK